MVKSDQETTDLTINTEAAPDFGNIPPADSYEGPDAADDLLPPEQEATAAAEPERSPTNAQLCDEAVAAAAILAANEAEQQTPPEQQISEWSLNNLRDAEWFRNTVIFLMLWIDRIGTGWTNWTIAAGAAIKTGWEKLCSQSAKSYDAFLAAWNRRFPRHATQDDLIVLGRALAMHYDNSNEALQQHVDNLTARIVAMEKIIKGNVPQICPADKLNAYTEAMRDGKRGEASRLYAALTGEKLGDAKAAIEKLV